MENGDFEQGHQGWLEIPGNAIITKRAYGGSHSGSWTAYFYSVGNHESIDQDITVPTDATTLEYYIRGTSDEGRDGSSFFVQVDDKTLVDEYLGELLERTTEDAAKTTWRRHTLDLSKYAGQTVNLMFRIRWTGTARRSRLYLDDIAFVSE